MKISTLNIIDNCASPAPVKTIQRRGTGRRAEDCGHDCTALDNGLELLAYARAKLKSASSASQVAHALALETEAINSLMAARNLPVEPSS